MLGAESRALKLYLIVAYVGAVGERYAILDPLLAKYLFGDQTFGVLTLIVLIGLAFDLEVSCGGLINHVAHFNDGALYSIRGAETQACIAAALARSAGNAAYSDEGSNIHVLHLDRIEHAGPREAENIVVGKSRIVVAVGQVQVNGQVVHRRSLRVVLS